MFIPRLSQFHYKTIAIWLKEYDFLRTKNNQCVRHAAHLSPWVGKKQRDLSAAQVVPRGLEPSRPASGGRLGPCRSGPQAATAIQEARDRRGRRGGKGSRRMWRSCRGDRSQ